MTEKGINVKHKETAMPEFKVDYERTKVVFDRLIDALRAKRYPYDFSKPPQIPENLPRSLPLGSLEHALYLFCACYWMRGGIESGQAFARLSRLYDAFPLAFLPKNFAGDNPRYGQADIGEMLVSHGLNYNGDQIARLWVYNARKLHDHWGGDPRNLYIGAADYAALCRRVMRSKRKGEDDGANGFPGFREKMVSMLTYFFCDAKLVGDFVYPIPVDFHVQRLMVAHKLIVVEGAGVGDNIYSEALLATARDLSVWYCQTQGVDPIELCDALWLLSTGICYIHPGNSTFRGTLNGRKTELTPVKVIWDDIQVDQFRRSCMSCPGRETCEFNIPAADYYVGGRLVIRSKRDEPLLLF